MSDLAARLYDSAYYQGHVVSVNPDRGDGGGDAVVYSLAYLGLRRLGSVQAPVEAAHPSSAFRQTIGRVTLITVWATKPEAWATQSDEHGMSWQQYSADTADLGAWAARSKYVRVWQQTEDAAFDSSLLTGECSEPSITILE
ncbi:hypothetical protein [Streptomyces sp. A0592]|uniref:hypothetical protein n=1 Tax=Streptomyces sp. A0592 TaxID=2563099 RepID=UPI00109E7F49|nr:hypothetical protein [Streptomyces sp. A0592]THA75809.1 hypothetical protein E6U81_36205 [Streptomyces sp. A0592]